MYHLIPLNYYDHWMTLVSMVKENYEGDEHQDQSLIYGEYVKRPIKDILPLIPKKNNQKIIVYQLEPLVKNHWWSIEQIVRNIRDADEVWDYDLENIEILKNYGIEAKYKPIAYSESLKKINSINPDIDLLFYGSFTDYRGQFINWFHNKTNSDLFYDFKFIWISGITGNTLDHFISRSKIILNLNPYSGDTRQQQTRIFYPLINEKCVVSQGSSINYFGDSILQFDDYDSLNRILLEQLKNEQWKNKKIKWNTKKNKIAIFLNFQNNFDFSKKFNEIISALQNTKWYDTADYIHMGIQKNQNLPYILNNINRTKKIDFENDTLIDLIKFSKLNLDYKILYIDNQYDSDFLFNCSLEQILKILSKQQKLQYVNSRSFIANSEYLNTLDLTFLNQPMNQEMFYRWLNNSI